MPAHRLPIVEFRTRAELRAWLDRNHAASAGVLVRLYRKGSGGEGIAFEDLLEEELCFGWSESQRLSGDARSYLQTFTPRRKRGTVSERNRRLVARLTAEGRMTAAGRAKL